MCTADPVAIPVACFCDGGWWLRVTTETEGEVQALPKFLSPRETVGREGGFTAGKPLVGISCFAVLWKDIFAIWDPKAGSETV